MMGCSTVVVVELAETVETAGSRVSFRALVFEARASVLTLVALVNVSFSNLRFEHCSPGKKN